MTIDDNSTFGSTGRPDPAEEFLRAGFAALRAHPVQPIDVETFLAELGAAPKPANDDTTTTVTADTQARRPTSTTLPPSTTRTRRRSAAPDAVTYKSSKRHLCVPPRTRLLLILSVMGSLCIACISIIMLWINTAASIDPPSAASLGAVVGATATMLTTLVFAKLRHTRRRPRVDSARRSASATQSIYDDLTASFARSSCGRSTVDPPMVPSLSDIVTGYWTTTLSTSSLAFSQSHLHMRLKQTPAPPQEPRYGIADEAEAFLSGAAAAELWLDHAVLDIKQELANTLDLARRPASLMPALKARGDLVPATRCSYGIGEPIHDLIFRTLASRVHDVLESNGAGSKYLILSTASSADHVATLRAEMNRRSHTLRQTPPTVQIMLWADGDHWAVARQSAEGRTSVVTNRTEAHGDSETILSVLRTVSELSGAARSLSVADGIPMEGPLEMNV